MNRALAGMKLRKEFGTRRNLTGPLGSSVGLLLNSDAIGRGSRVNSYRSSPLGRRGMGGSIAPQRRRETRPSDQGAPRRLIGRPRPFGAWSWKPRPLQPSITPILSRSPPPATQRSPYIVTELLRAEICAMPSYRLRRCGDVLDLAWSWFADWRLLTAQEMFAAISEPENIFVTKDRADQNP